ncbi:hypothetical protein HYPSUDRAFT_66202 [Hypholoma sublateritium FD-334 SS-4]|uniref:BTB domain-containing protein n=1 Tax=Hypholoma sublateritium (strain FD-334 SS-4) TaxID=945553 RepID=A0A0D2MIM0_HYPSF|nr:hypothetical protein HYPSUDRAFT_66202 [Hypholoma sublateritium FD-334 SS-4]
MEMQDGGIPTHPLFNDPSADIVVESSDGTRFRLHRKNIKVHTGSAFLGGLYCSSVDDPDITCLSEPGDVLEIVFQFLYPQKHPDLGAVTESESVVAIADAVGKYEIYGAMNACEIRLRPFLSDHPTEIFTYAFKNRNQELLNKTALILSRFPLHERLENLPPQCSLPWVNYQKTWTAVFDAIRTYIRTLLQGTGPGPTALCICTNRFSYNSKGICGGCYDFLRVWVLNLEKTHRFAELGTKIASSLTPVPIGQGLTNGCPHLPAVAKHSQTLIKKIPPFVSFLDCSEKKEFCQ